MRCTLTFLLLIIATHGNAQNQYSPFVGGFEFGLGYSSIIDFNRENNIKYNRDIKLEELFFLWPFIPYQFGFVTAKYIDNNSYVEFGILFRKTSVGWIDRRLNGWGLPGINFYSFDFPIKYYFTSEKSRLKYFEPYLGIIPSWLIYTEVFGSYAFDNISDEYFREGFLSFCGGLYKEKNNIRLKLHTSIAVNSVIKPAYRQDIPKEDRAYGGVIIPFEVLFCWAYVLK